MVLRSSFFNVDKYASFWLLAILMLALALRVYKLGDYGIFLDEKYTMVISQGIVMDGANQKDVFLQPTFTPKEFWKAKTLQDFFEANARGDIGNSPAYYAVVYSWMRVFGISDFSARFPSVIFSTLIVLLLYFFVRDFFKSKSLALLSSFIAAIEPFFIAYSHQARNYSFSFFLTLSATYLFLKIIENEHTSKKTFYLYIGYALLVGTCLLSHFLTFTVFIGHGLYVLLFFRKWRGWIGLGLSMAVGMGMMGLWMVYGAGQWTLDNLEDQAQVYRQAALTNPYNNPFGVILPATPQNVFVKALPMFSDLFLFSNGLYENLGGKKNSLLALLVGFLLIGVYRLAIPKPSIGQWGWLIGLGTIGISLFFYSQTPLLFGVMSVAIFLFYLLLEVLLSVHYPKHLLWLMVIMALLPNLFLVVWSFRNGHTYGLTQRYGGFSFPYSIILVSLVLVHLSQIKTTLKYAIFAFLIVQMGYVGGLLVKIYADESPKYTYFSKARRPNPYHEAAKKIISNYETGDTVKYPTVKYVFLTEKAKTFLPYSLQDAQLTNLYLPKEATYIQMIDTTEVSKIVLVKRKNQQKIILYDLEGQKHRY